MTDTSRSTHPATIAGRALLIAALVIYPLVAGKSFDWQNMVLHCIVSAALFAWCLGRWLSGRPVVIIRYPWLDWSLAAFFGLNLIAAVFSVYGFASILALVWLADCLIVYLMAREGFVGGYWRTAIIAAAVVAGAISAIWGLREYVHTVIFTGGETWRIFGPLYNPNILASYLIGPLLVAMGLLTVYLLNGAGNPGEAGSEDASGPTVRLDRIAVSVAVLTIAPAIFLTGSRGGLLALGAGLIVFLVMRLARVWSLRRAVVTALVIAVVLVAAAVVIPPIQNRLASAFSLQNHSVAFRYYTWLGTLDMATSNPLVGTGPGTFEYAYPGYAQAGFTRAAHQSFLQVAAESGVLSLLVMIAAGLAALRVCWKKAVSGEIAGAALASAAAGWIIALGVHNLLDYSIYIPAVTATACAVLGAALAPDETGSPTQTKPSMTPAVVGAIALIVGVWGYVGLQAVHTADQLAAKGQTYRAEQAAERATTLLPLSADAWAVLGEVYQTQVKGPEDPHLQAAIRMHRHAAALAPTQAKHRLSMARLYEFAGESDSALDAVKKAVEVYPTNPRGLADLARIQEELGRTEAATHTYRRLLDLRDTPVGEYQAVPEIPDYNYAWGWLHFAHKAFENGETEQGHELLLKAVDLLNRRLKGQQGLLKLQQQTTGTRPEGFRILGDLADRIQALLDSHPDPALSIRLSRTRELLGEWRARERLLRGVADDYESAESPDDAEHIMAAAAYLELGDLYEGQGEDSYAREEYRTGLRLLEGLPVPVKAQDLPEGARNIDVERLNRLCKQAERALQQR